MFLCPQNKTILQQEWLWHDLAQLTEAFVPLLPSPLLKMCVGEIADHSHFSKQGRTQSHLKRCSVLSWIMCATAMLSSLQNEQWGLEWLLWCDSNHNIQMQPVNNPIKNNLWQVCKPPRRSKEKVVCVHANNYQCCQGIYFAPTCTKTTIATGGKLCVSTEAWNSLWSL